MKPSKRELLIDHVGNLESAVHEKIEDLERGIEMLGDILQDLMDGKPFVEKDIRADLKHIWSSVMETPYDPKY